ncbi:hypothetical protein DSCA_55180 [Desulfosarcina alkanivorans]|uniref:FecR protein domain-containing protein n=1 Tax=Desulfosarcina alkanivorans TaxID=571177 RepID=A0A5K7YSG8_9BACT|nr:FecR domain-containing protein [Desulfosarcina alkanivorans]BBO71588.1 hypothetical protein DSCA_55180 [Desulfosarcina alkanivorans]
MRIAHVALLWMVVLLAGLCPPASAQPFVGVVKSVEGGVTVERHGERFTVVAGMQINQADTIKTDGRGYVGLVFSDDTRISMGPGTELVIDDYLFQPVEKNLSFIVRLIRGTVSFLSGQMTRLAPESVQLILPAATIGVRGTHVLIKVD